MKRPAVFLDRDDTLIRCRGLAPHGDLGDPTLVELCPGASEACRLLHDAGFALVVVTNQGGVARGRYTTADVEAVHDRINRLLAGWIDAFRYCPYHPDGSVQAFAREHPWRKPAPGMLLDAAATLDLDLTASWMIGDMPRDCAAGRGAGCRTILIADGPPPALLEEAGPDACCPTLIAGAEHILRTAPIGAPDGAGARPR